MVDLPDDAIEVAKVAVICAARAAYLPLDHAAAVAVAAAEPVIAARVRAEALREAAEKIAPNQVRPSNVIVVGARMTDDVLDMVRTVEDALVAAVRAEAVAAERQRIKATVWTQRGLLADREHTLAVVNRIIDAAGSVPVATPPATCASWVSSNHDDEDVSRCGGQSVGEWFSTSGQWQPICARHSEGVPSDRLRAIQVGPVATPEPVRFKDTLPIEVHEATAVAYVRLSDAPVARTGERVKDVVLVDYASDGYPVGIEIHFAGPVATPTEPDGAALIASERRRQVEAEGWTPDHDGEHYGSELAWAAVCYAAPEPVYKRVGDLQFVDPWPLEWSHDVHRGEGGWVSWRRTEGDRLRQLVKAGALIAAEIDRLQEAPPVPAEQPEER